jgi:nitrite reductase/ring-hydroxylating ferredoxin subunit
VKPVYCSPLHFTTITNQRFMQSLRVFWPLRTSLKLPFSPTARLQRPAFSTTATIMAQEYKLKDVTSLSLKNGEKKEVEVEGVEGGKVLLLKVQDKVHATSANCTHYGAPLSKGVLTPDGRLTCPWHGGTCDLCVRPTRADTTQPASLSQLETLKMLPLLTLCQSTKSTSETALSTLRPTRTHSKLTGDS